MSGLLFESAPCLVLWGPIVYTGARRSPQLGFGWYVDWTTLEFLLTKRSHKTLMRRLRAAGVPLGAWRKVVLYPDWWSKECESDVAVLGEVELRVCRILGVPLSVVRDPEASIEVSRAPGARLRVRSNADRERLSLAVQVAVGIAGALARSVSREIPGIGLPSDPLELRARILESGGVVSLASLTAAAWDAGIAVGHMKKAARLPDGGFQGLACVVDGAPVILLAEQHESPARLLFHLGHEIGHHALGHVVEGAPVVDERVELAESSEDIEREADRYSLMLLSGREESPHPTTVLVKSGQELASRVDGMATSTRIDPGHMVEVWAHKAGHKFAYGIAGNAHKILGTSTGGMATLARAMRGRTDFDLVSDQDHDLLLALSGVES